MLVSDEFHLAPLRASVCCVCGASTHLWHLSGAGRIYCQSCLYRFFEGMNQKPLLRRTLAALVLDYARVVCAEHVSWCSWCCRQDIALSWRIDHLLAETQLAPFYDPMYMTREMLAELAGLPPESQEGQA